MGLSFFGKVAVVTSLLCAPLTLQSSALVSAQTHRLSQTVRKEERTDYPHPWLNPRQSIASRVQELLSAMTLADKIAMLHGIGMGTYVGMIPANSRLGIPALHLEDGPAGVADGMTQVTQLPAPIALSATWDVAAADRYGQVIGAQERGKGANINLGPTVNIVRDPRWGRAFETLGEDPWLTSQMAVAEIEGIQSQGVMAEVKHFAVYNQETYRNTPLDDAIVSARVLHEIYLPAFAAAVRNAHVASVMDAYSTINGQYATQNVYLDHVLKAEWHFAGFVTSDWGAQHATLPAAKAGLDIEMPDGQYFGVPLQQAVETGQFSLAAIDAKVRRILFEMFRFGLFNHADTGNPRANVATPEDAATALRIAEEGTVLLKDDQAILPLTHPRSIAVIGYDASTDPLTAGGGSAHVIATTIVTPLQGIEQRAGRSIQVDYAQGVPAPDTLTPIPSTVLAQPYQSSTDSYTSILTPSKTGHYIFGLSDDHNWYTQSTLWIDHRPLATVAATPGDHTASGALYLKAGQHYELHIAGPSTALTWSDATTTAAGIAQAVQLAKTSSLAIVFASTPSSEGMDRSTLSLGGGQDLLIEAVARANPHTIVVLNTGSAVVMPWLPQVRGVMEAWYPGQEDGPAIAALLFGDVNPSGHLPITFPTSLAAMPTSSPTQFPGVNGKVYYSEGLDVGYRWYTAHQVAPLFPFGYGLSYTTFAFRHLRVSPTTEPAVAHVTVDVTNTGTTAGDAVAQLYVSDPAAAHEPPVQLKGFQRLYIKPGQTKRVVFSLDSEALAIWDTAAHHWTTLPGTYRVMIGTSAISILASGTWQYPAVGTK